MAESKKKTTKKTAPPRKKSGGSKGRRKKKPVRQKKKIGLWLLCVGLFLLSVLVLSFVLNRKSPPESAAKPAPKVVVSKKCPIRIAQPPLVKKIHPPKQSESETLALPPLSELAAGIKEIDLAVLQTVVALGLNVEFLQNSGVEVKQYGQEVYCLQTFRLTAPVNPSDFKRILRSNLALVNDAQLKIQENGEFHILWKKVPTHVISLAAVLKPQASPKKSFASLVVIVDDMGESKEACRRLGALDFPVTLSVLPFTSHARETAAFARREKMELMLHLPCEPVGYPETANPGPGSLFLNMSDIKILELLRKDIAAVPGVVGVNNHMGSRFTQDERRMRLVLKELRRQHLFFLDSLTSPGSRVQAAAKKERLPYIRRNIFLDNVQKQSAILRQLKKAEALAKKRGACVAIGHPYPVTLATLEKWQGMRDKSVVMTTISRLLKEKRTKK